MSLGGGPGQTAEINVTPLINILLVRLVIFQITTPSLSTCLDALAPSENLPLGFLALVAGRDTRHCMSRVGQDERWGLP
jgi:hypothetical protein